MPSVVCHISTHKHSIRLIIKAVIFVVALVILLVSERHTFNLYRTTVWPLSVLHIKQRYVNADCRLQVGEQALSKYDRFQTWNLQAEKRLPCTY